MIIILHQCIDKHIPPLNTMNYVHEVGYFMHQFGIATSCVNNRILLSRPYNGASGAWVGKGRVAYC